MVRQETPMGRNLLAQNPKCVSPSLSPFLEFVLLFLDTAANDYLRTIPPYKSTATITTSDEEESQKDNRGVGGLGDCLSTLWGSFGLVIGQ